MDPQRLPGQAHAQQPPAVRPQDTVGGFGLTVDGVFAITGRGTVVTGRVESGVVEKGMPVTLTGAGHQLGTTAPPNTSCGHDRESPGRHRQSRRTRTEQVHSQPACRTYTAHDRVTRFVTRNGVS
jgi:hypothetical protein